MTKEKYTHKQKKIFMIFSIVFFVLSVVFAVAGFVSDNILSTAVPTWLIVLVVNGSFFSIPIFAISFAAFIDQSFNLRRIERHKEGESNAHSKDSVAAFIVALVVFALSMAGNVSFIIKWHIYGVMDQAMIFAVPLCFVSFVILIRGVLFLRQKNTEKYIDYADTRDGRRVRTDVLSACARLVVWGLIAAMAILQADSMTKYIYKSNHGRYDKEIEDFRRKATMNVSSESLKDGVWDYAVTDIDGVGRNQSPQLSFDKVDGAEYYVIYMVDESANNWVHWYAEKVTETELPMGANMAEYSGKQDFLYRGPYPPAGSGQHVYTVYVYALKAEPDIRHDGPEFDEPWFAGDILYYDILNVSDSSLNPHLYGNVLAYGYVSGTVERR